MLQKIIISTFICMLLIIMPAYAEFIGPSTVIEGQWGSGNTDFGFESGDTMDAFPGLLRVDESGNIIIGDGVNFRIKIYGPTGIWQKNLSYKNISPIGGWPANLQVKSGVGIFTIYEKLQKYDYDGNLVWAIQVPGTNDFWIMNDGGIWLQQYPSTKTYSLYSPTGQLIRTTTERPLELGKVSEKKSATGYTYTIQYPDITNPNTVKTYTVSVARPAKIVTRDRSGNLYITTTTEREFEDDRGIYWSGNDMVYRFDTQNNLTGTMQIPDTQTGPEQLDGEYWSPLIVGYGEPVIAPTGDVYTWKRTPTTYSIIKWTWRP